MLTDTRKYPNLPSGKYDVSSFRVDLNYKKVLKAITGIGKYVTKRRFAGGFEPINRRDKEEKGELKISI
jgi:hypothetical protein